MKKSNFILLGLIVFYIIARILVISSNRDQIFDYSEFFSGTIAMELIQGPLLPLKYCMSDDHNFGSIVNGILIVPFYRLFGPSLASSKMVPILFSLGVLIIWYLLLNRFFNRRIAVVASLLFIFSPTVYTKNSILSIGSHPESNFFTAIILFIMYLIFFDNKKKNRYFILLGLISGFGFFYSYLCGITLLVLLIFWFAFNRKFMLTLQFYLFLLFFIIGFSPRFYFAEGVKPAFGGAVNFLQNAINWQNLFSAQSIIKSKTFLLEDLPRLFSFEHLPYTIQYIYYSFFLISFFYLLWNSMKSMVPLKNKIIAKEGPLLMLFFIFSFVYILSSYSIWGGWSCAGYIIPLYPAIFMIIAISLDKLMWAKNRFLKISTAIFLSLILLAGLYENIVLISFRHIGLGFMVKGYSYRFFGERVGSYNCGNVQFLEAMRKIDFSKRQHFLVGLGWSSGIFKRENSVVSRKIIILPLVSDQEKLYYYKGFGRGFAQEMDFYLFHKKNPKLTYNPEFKLWFIKHIIEKEESDLQQYFWEGFGEEVTLSSDTYKIIKDYIKEEFKPYFYRGIGETMAWYILVKDENLDDIFRDIKPEYKKYAIEGYQKTRSEMLLNDHR